jgi:hypothetical protein
MPQGHFSLGMPNLHQPQHVGPRSCDLHQGRACGFVTRLQTKDSAGNLPGLQILWLGWEAEAVHTARQLAFAYDLLGILDLETSWGSFTEQNSCSRWWYQSN